MSDHESTAKLISKIKLPGNSTVYEIHDANAIHTVEELGLSQALVFKGTITPEELNQLVPSSVNVGDVYICEGTEYVCIEVDGTKKWEPLGDVHDAASSTHKHKVTVTKDTTKNSNVLGSNTTFGISGDVATKKLALSTASQVTASDVSINHVSNAGTVAKWSATVDDNGLLTFAWTANTLPTLTTKTASKVTANNITVATGSLVTDGNGASVVTGKGTIGVGVVTDDVKSVLTSDSIPGSTIVSGPQDNTPNNEVIK